MTASAARPLWPEVRSHVDTHYFYEKTMGTEIKQATVFQRLAALRAGAED
jgi:hypothetical protein